jgi:hypothetical protein
MDNNENPDQPTDLEVLAEIAAATARRQAIIDDLEILSRHLADPDNNPL